MLRFIIFVRKIKMKRGDINIASILKTRGKHYGSYQIPKPTKFYSRCLPALYI